MNMFNIERSLHLFAQSFQRRTIEMLDNVAETISRSSHLILTDLLRLLPCEIPAKLAEGLS